MSGFFDTHILPNMPRNNLDRDVSADLNNLYI